MSNKEETKNLVNKKSNGKKKNLKKIIVATTSVILAALLTVGVFLGITKKNKKNKGNDNIKGKDSQTQITSDDIDQISEVELSDLGVALETSKEEAKNNEYRNPTGDIDPNEIVVGDDGTLWVDEDAANKSDKIGETIIDDQGGNLYVDSDGNVNEKDPGYEIKDDNDNTIDSGDYDDVNYAPNGDPIPNGYAWDSGRNEIVPEAEVGKYIYSDLTFYFEDGTVAINKGDLVSKETYNRAKKELYTTKPPVKETTSNYGEVPQETTAPETTTPETTPSQNTDSYGGVVNPNGTYTIYGITYMDKATFELFVMDEAACGYYNGIIYPISVINEMNNENTLVK